jgi:2-polyprenyl-3-methyl-5-hydroxy-6-metoxy-1,4-benzoquinol methylase
MSRYSRLKTRRYALASSCTRRLTARARSDERDRRRNQIDDRQTDDRVTPRLCAVDARHPLQPDWKSGTHADRFARVRRYLEHRSVLDIGAGSGIDRPDWMHALVASVAAEAVGIELDESLANRAAGKGFDVVAADAQTVDLGRTFQVVWAGELIEHLSCAGGFLDAARRHLEPDGVLVLTTPNAFAVSNFVYRVGGRPRVNKGHTCWYDETTLCQLLRRHGYEILEVSYVAHRTPGRLRAFLASAVRSVLPRHLAENTLLVVATPAL